MGQSTDAILCYGVELGVEDSDLCDNEPDLSFDEAYFMYLFPDEEFSYDKADRLPVELVRHCSGDYEMYIMASRPTVTVAHRGNPLEITDFEEPINAAFEIRRAIMWLRKNFPNASEIPHELRVPTWLLASNWN